MTSDKTTEDQALEKLRKMIAGGEATIFTAEEVTVIRDIIRVYRGLRALGWMGTFVRNVILVIMTIVTAYAAVTGALTDWIKKIAGVS